MMLLEHRAHAIDFHPLIGIDIRREREDVAFLSGARRLEQLVDHRDRAAVVLDHALQEQAIELHALGGGERRHLLGVNMPGIMPPGS